MVLDDIPLFYSTHALLNTLWSYPRKFTCTCTKEIQITFLCSLIITIWNLYITFLLKHSYHYRATATTAEHDIPLFYSTHDIPLFYSTHALLNTLWSYPRKFTCTCIKEIKITFLCWSQSQTCTLPSFWNTLIITEQQQQLSMTFHYSIALMFY